MSKRVFIVGVGPGNIRYVPEAAMDLITSSDVLIGGKRNLASFGFLNKETVTIGSRLDRIAEYLKENVEVKKITLLASGDPGFYSIAEFLKTRLPGVDLVVIPGISSVQYLAGKLVTSLNDACVTSVHGRGPVDLIDLIRKNKKVAVFTGGEFAPDSICRTLCQKGLTNLKVSVGENLSYENERIVVGTPEEIGALKFSSLSVMLVEKTSEKPENAWKYSTPGLPDDMFVRGDVPMTKEEVRALSLAKMRLETDSVVYDIGAGTGSVSIECGLRCKNGTVYSIEKRVKAIELISKNIKKFGLDNVRIIKGTAPGVLAGLPEPDRVFIGGTSGQMGEILAWIGRTLQPVRVVINTVTIESTYEAIHNMESNRFQDIEVTSISVARSRNAGGKRLMQAVNPVYVICANKGGLL